jgi:hypothetical protein
MMFKSSMSVIQIYEHLMAFYLYESFVKCLTDFPLDFHEAFQIFENQTKSEGIKTFSLTTLICHTLI